MKQERPAEIINVQHIRYHILQITFSDGYSNEYDFAKIFQFRGIAETLKNIDYFKKVKISTGGDVLFWEKNGYDVCAENLRYFVKNN